MPPRPPKRTWFIAVALVLTASFLAAAHYDWLSVEDVNVLIAAMALLTAVAAWLATNRASDTAEESHATAIQAQRTAESLAAIERDRWHAELTPQLEVVVKRPSPSTDRAAFSIKLVGPSALHSLDSVIVEVQDDGVDRTPRTAPPPTAEDVAAHIWGPLCFIASIDDVVEPGRRTPPFPLRLGDSKPFDMRNTLAPFWWDDTDAYRRWRLEVRTQPVRLRIECRRQGDRPWHLYMEIPIQSSYTPQ